MRNGVRVEEDSNHTTSQIMVDTSANTVYNNTLRVRRRESHGTYECTISNNRSEYIAKDDSHDEFTVMREVQGMLVLFFKDFV